MTGVRGPSAEVSLWGVGHGEQEPVNGDLANRAVRIGEVVVRSF
jgi:hypothetical protein